MMAAELPRGRFRHRGLKQRKDPAITTTTTTSEVKSSMDLPSLVRTGPPPVGLRHVRLTLGGVSKFRQAARSVPEPVVNDFETKRRQKLRGVIAMMEMSKRPVKRKNDVETHLNERAKAMEGAKRRTKAKGNNQATKSYSNVTNGKHNEGGNDDEDDDKDNHDDDDRDAKKRALATMGKWQSFIRRKKVLTKGRRAGFAGFLPVRKGSGVSNRQKDDQKDKLKPKTLGRFRTVVKLIIYLLRLSRTYIYKESDARMVSLFSDIDAARAGDHYKIRGDLLYDVTEYKALKSQKISKDTKRILLMDPKKRSKKDIHHVMVELQQMKGITQYPVDMQRGLVANSWYEEYPTGRVIIRYGRSPQAFYVVLGGSALHLEGDPNIPGRPVSSLNKGDMFGEQAIAHQDKHVYTVISKEAIQLMCLAPDDYCRIFLAGGLDNFSDLGEHSFVRSIGLFKHWPIHLLKNNHKQTRFQYFVHGTTIVEDSVKSEWIIIVKSGSCSVLKKLIDPLPNGIPAIAPVIKRKKSIVPTTRYKRDFVQPAETHQEMLSRRLKELQKKRAKSIKNSRWQRYIKKPTNLLKIPLHDDPFEEPNMSQDYRGERDPVAADMYQRYEESLKAPRLKPTDASNMSKNHVLTEDNTSGVSMTEDGGNDEGDQRDETEEEPMDTLDTSHEQKKNSEAEIVMGGRKQSFAKGPFMTHRSAATHRVREPSKINDSNTGSTRNNNGARRDSMAQSEGGVPKQVDSVSYTDGLSRRNSLARRDSVIQRRGSVNRRNSNALMETSGDGRESVTQDSGMTDLTEASTYEQGESSVAGKGDEEEYESNDDDEDGQTEAPPEPVHKFVMIDTLEKGGVFGVLDMAFGSQPSLSLVSNGAECIMVRKKFFKKHSNDKTVWNINQMFRPYPDEDTLTKDLREKLTWKDHRDVTLKETALKFKKMRKRLADPRLQRPNTIVESFS